MDRQIVETRIDFVQYLDIDLSMYIMSFLDDPADLVRASSVSHVWHHFVIANGLIKDLWLKTCPRLSNIVGLAETERDRCFFEKNHNAFAALLHALTKSRAFHEDCIADAVRASSTRRYPRESIVNTLDPRYGNRRTGLCWSSKGQSSPDVPEVLLYKLHEKTWLITEVYIQPFEAFLEPGKPVYSAKSVRISVGYRKSLTEIEKEHKHSASRNSEFDMFVWNYTSPEFPMMQENRLQQFKLPKPVLSIDGYLRVELLGRAQKQESDGLFYIRLCRAKVVGKPLYPAFDIKMLEPTGRLLLKYKSRHLSSVVQGDSSHLLYQSERAKVVLRKNLRIRKQQYWLTRRT